MYINDIHILLYVVAGILGFIVGAITNYCNHRKENIYKRHI